MKLKSARSYNTSKFSLTKFFIISRHMAHIYHYTRNFTTNITQLSNSKNYSHQIPPIHRIILYKYTYIKSSIVIPSHRLSRTTRKYINAKKSHSRLVNNDVQIDKNQLIRQKHSNIHFCTHKHHGAAKTSIRHHTIIFTSTE